MHESTTIRPENGIPMHWKYFLLFVVVAKAAVLGASIGLAALGAMDVAVAISASEWLTEAKREYFIDYFAIGGGAIGATGQLLYLIFGR